MTQDVQIRPASSDDVEQIAEIYNHYVLTSTITFEDQPVSVSEMAHRVLEIRTIPLPWLVARFEDDVLGYAYASKWKTRAAYRFSVESTIYLSPSSHRSGIGSKLYQCLLDELADIGAHAVIGGIALPNEASWRLHQKLGFQQVAHFKEVGFKFDRWIDVTYWQRILR